MQSEDAAELTRAKAHQAIEEYRKLTRDLAATLRTALRSGLPPDALASTLNEAAQHGAVRPARALEEMRRAANDWRASVRRANLETSEAQDDIA